MDDSWKYEKYTQSYSDFIHVEVEKECSFIANEMAVHLIFNLVNKLDLVDRQIIRYSWGLPKTYDRNDFYPKLSRKEIAQKLNLKPLEVLRRREEAIKRLFKMAIS